MTCEREIYNGGWGKERKGRWWKEISSQANSNHPPTEKGY